MSEDTLDKNAVLTAVQAIVSAYLGNNQIPMSEVPAFINSVTLALTTSDAVPIDEPLRPSVPVNKSVTSEKITCLECGATYKSLKRHLRTHHDLTPKTYRERWGLPATYPMVAPAYSKSRSALAKEKGLGQRKKPVSMAAE
jgi:predicted transcriptional regulator